MTQTRKSNGQYGRKFRVRLSVFVFAVACLAASVYIHSEYIAPRIIEKAETGEVAAVAQAVFPSISFTKDETLKEKIDELKSELLVKLADCESGSTEEPAAAIILDTNNKMSIGKYMWQIQSVQHYVSLFYDRDVNRKDAILIALDSHSEISLEELTTKVVFEDTKNLDNWKNCANRKQLVFSKRADLYAELDFIKRLEK